MKKEKALPIHRIRDSKGTIWRVEIRIKFGDFYHTKNGCVLNVDDFGDCEVEIAWKRDHNHKEPESDECEKMQMNDKVRKAVAAGLGLTPLLSSRKKKKCCLVSKKVKFLQRCYELSINTGSMKADASLDPKSPKTKTVRKARASGCAPLSSSSQGHKIWSFSSM